MLTILNCLYLFKTGWYSGLKHSKYKLFKFIIIKLYIVQNLKKNVIFSELFIPWKLKPWCLKKMKSTGNQIYCILFFTNLEKLMFKQNK